MEQGGNRLKRSSRQIENLCSLKKYHLENEEEAMEQEKIFCSVYIDKGLAFKI